MSKKRAFTMVELIFVIAILGILAAVAVPRLAASRKDAEATTLKANIITAMKDIQSYYAANDKLGELKEMTNVPLSTIKCDTVAIASTNGEPCLGLIVRNTTTLAVFYYHKQTTSSCDEAMKSPELRALLSDGTSTLADKASKNPGYCTGAYSYKESELQYGKSAVEW